jgi:hypothetical protein
LTPAPELHNHATQGKVQGLAVQSWTLLGLKALPIRFPQQAIR